MKHGIPQNVNVDHRAIWKSVSSLEISRVIGLGADERWCREQIHGIHLHMYVWKQVVRHGILHWFHHLCSAHDTAGFCANQKVLLRNSWVGGIRSITAMYARYVGHTCLYCDSRFTSRQSIKGQALVFHLLASSALPDCIFKLISLWSLFQTRLCTHHWSSH